MLFWKINRRIVACMLGTYFCQALDKGTLSFSSIMGIQEDTNLVGQQYSWLGTILYMGVLVGEYPTNVLLQKLPVAKYLSANVFCWGVVIACSAACKNFGSLMAVRFLLGVFESCVQPSFIIMTSMWVSLETRTFTQDMFITGSTHSVAARLTPSRLLAVYQKGTDAPDVHVVLHDGGSAHGKQSRPIPSGSPYRPRAHAPQVGGIIAWGVSQYVGHAILPWQLLFLILGCLTCAWGLFIGWWLPDTPMGAKCFSEDEKRLMVERVRANETGIQNKVYKRYQAVEALTDPIVWLYVMLQLTSTLVIGGLGVFSNLIISSFGFTYLETQLLNIAQGAVTIVVMVGSAALCTWTNQTAWVMHVSSLD